MLLDSNIVIYAAESACDNIRIFIAKHHPVVSVIAKVEVLGYHRLSGENRQKLERLFRLMPISSLSDEIADRAICLRQTRNVFGRCTYRRHGTGS
ncbi:MAG: hypothetical protein B6245_21960 [Desulfobacteraceae bacterium 4572_88]|nr:MAG: hypothetical protein B6245_21960 [Desulfobacteraceae bacterium 4572_88]